MLMLIKNHFSNIPTWIFDIFPPPSSRFENKACLFPTCDTLTVIPLNLVLIIRDVAKGKAEADCSHLLQILYKSTFLG